MKVDAGLTAAKLGDVAEMAKSQEAAGYDGTWTAETANDPFFPLLLAAEHTSTIELGTSIAVAFARSPMTLANQANDLQRFSEGRFILGLGSQIKPHIEKRFSMPWSHPAPRMRELVLAMRAIWSAWNDRTKLDFRGEFYTHTLMTPFFDPGPNPHGVPAVYLAAVGELMSEVAGEVCDGIFVHGFTTERYLKEVTLPAVERGLAKGGKSRSDFTVSYPGFIVTGTSDEQLEKAAAGTRQQIAFYGSTPAYRPVLELHGWGDLQTELNTLSKSDRADKWQAMGGLITDDILNTFAVVAEPEQVAEKVLARYGGAVDRLSFYAPYQADPERWLPVVEALRKA
jgi:probable F420-dependent oxidoreductase